MGPLTPLQQLIQQAIALAQAQRAQQALLAAAQAAARAAQVAAQAAAQAVAQAAQLVQDQPAAQASAQTAAGPTTQPEESRPNRDLLQSPAKWWAWPDIGELQANLAQMTHIREQLSAVFDDTSSEDEESYIFGLSSSVRAMQVNEGGIWRAISDLRGSGKGTLEILFARTDEIPENAAQQLLRQQPDCSGYDPTQNKPVWNPNKRRVEYFSEQQLCLLGWENYPPRGATTSTPPTPASSAIVFFGGSAGCTLDNPDCIYDLGPDPTIQTPAWVNAGFSVVIQYPGVPSGIPGPDNGKRGQAAQATGYEDSSILVIGFSAGADTGLIFAENYLQTNAGSGHITGVAVLGGTMSGTMFDGRDLGTAWPNVLNDLICSGTDVYILDDAAAGGSEAIGYTPQCPSGSPLGRFLFDQRPQQEHWQGGTSGTGTNNSEAFRDCVLEWFDDPSLQTLPCSF